MTKLELHWLAGLLEGEGSFLASPPSSRNQPRISLSMTDRDVVERAATLLSVRGIQMQVRGKERGWKPAYSVILKGSRGVALMKVLRPLMGARRQQQIDRALLKFKPIYPGLNGAAIASIRRRLRTSTVSQLSREYGIARKTVRAIRDGREPAPYSKRT